MSPERWRWLGLRWRGWFRSHRKEVELERELQFHLGNLADNYIAEGMTPTAARQAARREFGSLDAYRESCRDTWRPKWISDLGSDLRHGARRLRKSPGFAAVSILTLAIGIGATTAIFSVFNSVLLRPLGFTDSHQLVEIRQVRSGPEQSPVRSRLATFQAWNEQVTSYAEFATYSYLSGNLTDVAHPIRLTGNFVTPNYFRLLGVQPALGRDFRDDEARPDRANVFILTHQFWQTQFGGRPDIIGQIVRFRDHPFTIIGVLPEGIRNEPGGPRAFAPLVPGQGEPYRRGLMHVVGRLKPDVSLAEARSEMQVLDQRMAATHPDLWGGIETRVVPMLDFQVEHIRPSLHLLFGAVFFLLLIACVNVANLTLARASSRQSEIAMRGALGASRGRIIRQLLTESLLVAAIGGIGGALLAFAAMPVILGFAPAAMPRMDEVQLDGMALCFCGVITTVTGIGSGLLPAWQSTRFNLASSLNGGARTVGAGRASSRLRKILVVAEVSLAVILLAGAGLLTRSFLNLQQTDLGFDPENIYASRIELERDAYSGPDRQLALIDRALAQIARQPNIAAAAVSTSLPFYHVLELGMDFASQPQPPDNLPTGGYFAVTPGYFSLTRTPLLQGRLFDSRDRANSPRVAIISERLADRFFANQSPLGQPISFVVAGERAWAEIVGVVAETRHWGAPTIGAPQVYMPIHQNYIPARILFAVRNRPGAPNPGPQVAAAIQAVDPDIGVDRELVDLATFADNAVSLHRFCLFLFGIFSAVAVLLAGLGVYGVVAYSVNQRRTEIGVRMALGARPADILRLILHHTTTLVLAGLIIGLLAALAGSRLLGSVLYGVSPQDPVTLSVISVGLAGVAVGAGFLAAYRATGINPSRSLRTE